MLSVFLRLYLLLLYNASLIRLYASCHGLVPAHFYFELRFKLTSLYLFGIAKMITLWME